MKATKRKMLKAYADVGSHGRVFVFEAGPVADRYPGLLQIYVRKITPGLVPVTITYTVKA